MKDNHAAERILKERGASVLDNPKSIAFFRVKVLRSALWLEIRGMKRKGRSAFRILKDEFGFTGSKQDVLRQVDAYISSGGATR